MNEEVYNHVTKLQDLLTEEANLMADIISSLDELAMLYEKGIE